MYRTTTTRLLGETRYVAPLHCSALTPQYNDSNVAFVKPKKTGVSEVSAQPPPPLPYSPPFEVSTSRHHTATVPQQREGETRYVAPLHCSALTPQHNDSDEAFVKPKKTGVSEVSTQPPPIALLTPICSDDNA